MQEADDEKLFDPRFWQSEMSKRGEPPRLESLSPGAAIPRGKGQGAQCAAGACPPSLTVRRLNASGTAARDSSVSTQKTSMYAR